MSEANQEQAQTTEQAKQGDPAEGLREGGLKALQAEREARSAADQKVKTLEAKLDEYEKERLTELERAQAEAAQYKAAAESATTAALRFKVAAKAGISDEDAELFLTGTDEETLTRQAARLAERQTPQPGAVAPEMGAGNGAHALNSTALETALKNKLGIS